MMNDLVYLCATTALSAAGAAVNPTDWPRERVFWVSIAAGVLLWLINP